MRLNRQDAPLRDQISTLRQKTLIIVSITVTSLISVLHLTTSGLLIQSYARLEEQNTQENVERVLAAFSNNISVLDATNSDWANWDDTYAFVHHSNQNFIDQNLATENFTVANVNILLFYDAAGKLVYGKVYDDGSAQSKTLFLQSLERYIQSNAWILQHHTLTSSHVGVVLLPEEPIILTSRPILTSQKSGPIQGTLVMGRCLDATTVQQLAETTQLRLKFYRLNQLNQQQNSLPVRLRTVRASLQTAQNKTQIVVQPQTANLVSGYALIDDITNQPALLVEVDLPRKIYQQGQQSLHYLAALLIIVGILSGTIAQLLLEKLIRFQYQLQEREARYRAVVTQTSEGILLVNVNTKRLLEANDACLQLLNYSNEKILTLTLYDIVSDDRQNIDHKIQDLLIYKSQLPPFEQKYYRQDQTIVDVEVSANLISYAQDVICVVIRDITERKISEATLRESEQRLAWQASHDVLTGLVNRREFERQLEQALDEIKIKGCQHSLCYLDLDQFKIVNDTCGHGVGDDLLRQVTDLLRSQIRSSDVLARLGGDEFGLLLYHCPLDQAEKTANTLCQSLRTFRFSWQDKIFNVGASIGLVALDSPGQTLATTMSAADAACYVAKNNGRNRVHVYQSDDRELTQQYGEMQWVGRITQALEEDRFCLYYQSIIPVALGQGESEHYEVLLRLRDERGNLVAPMAFIPAAERYNLMHLIDRWVIRTLFASQSSYYQEAWQRSQTQEFRCLYTINLSGASINDNQFVSFLHEQFALHQVPPQVICFEITETVAITNLNRAMQLMQEFKRLGCRFALDDFGSGMSSFSYLKSLPVDYLKIDGDFIRNTLSDPTHLAMAEAINQIGHLMKIQTIAEFVENDQILQHLRTIGVDYAQGYGIAKPRPLPSGQTASLLSERVL
jgi:diguanylate cyclase (GGDEF)-like protein/PAS domain S-box-containing protein